MPTLDSLTQLDRDLLDVVGAFTSLDERTTFPVLHARFGNATRAWQQVNALLDTQAALQYAPDTVSRLRRRRAAPTELRARARSSGSR